jgi:hypothetical protein
VNPALLAKAVAGMAGQVTLEEFCQASGIPGRSVAKDVAEFLLARGIGTSDRGMLRFSGRDRVEAAMFAIQAGCDPEQVSGSLSWKDFEGLASHVLSSLGYRACTNVRFSKPRMEIDVVGIDGAFAVAVDCKHWKRANPSAISTFCARQAARAQELVRKEPGIAQALPAVLTLHAERAAFVGGVPVVPVSKLGSFLADVRTFLPELRVVTRQGPA